MPSVRAAAPRWRLRTAWRTRLRSPRLLSLRKRSLRRAIRTRARASLVEALEQDQRCCSSAHQKARAFKLDNGHEALVSERQAFAEAKPAWGAAADGQQLLPKLAKLR